MKTLRRKNEEGQMILIIIIFLALLMTMASALVGYTTLQLKGERQAIGQSQALYLAEAGMNKAIYQLNQNGGYSGETDTALAGGQFTVTVSTIDGNNKLITSTGNVPNSSSPTATKSVKARVSIDSTQISFNFGVQVGPGGLLMDPNTQINGNVYAGGNITGSGTITGDAIVSAGVSPDPDQSWSGQDSDFFFGNISSRMAVAQSFSPSADGRLNKVSVYLKKINSPADLTVQVVSDNSGRPSKNVLASGTISASTITGTYGFTEGGFTSPLNIAVNQTYWLMLVPSSLNANAYFSWGKDSTDGYANGTGKYSDDWNKQNANWTSAGGDFAFKTYMGGADTYIDGITIGGNATAHTLQGCTITGDANYAFVNTCTTGGTLNPNQQDAPPAAMPISDAQIQEWKNVASGGGVISGPYTINGSTSLGPKEINGNLVVNGTLTMTGPIWVNGDITFSNGAHLTLDPSIGGSGTVLLADYPADPANGAKINFSNNVVVSGSGQQGSYPLVISTSTSDHAIDLSNNVVGAIFYAANGTMNISNNVTLKQLTGHFIHLSNNATINYESGLVNAGFTNGPGGSWALVRNSYVIVR